MIKKAAWLFRHKESIIDSWELGIDEQGNEITETEYADFEERCWQSFDESQVDGELD